MSSLLDAPAKRPRRTRDECAPVIAIDSRMTPDPFVMLPIASGEVAIVDHADIDRVSGHCFFVDNNYPACSIDGVSARLHRIIVREVPPDHVVDHRNGDTFDNRRINLRVVTPQENADNRPGTPERRRQLAAIQAQFRDAA